ncbi:MAG: glycosyl hydrolase [Smithellaceae bacterium]
MKVILQEKSTYPFCSTIVIFILTIFLLFPNSGITASQCTPGTSINSLTRQPSSGTYYYLGIGDKDGKVVCGGKSGIPANDIFMYGKYDTKWGGVEMRVSNSSTTAPDGNSPVVGLAGPGTTGSSYKIANLPDPSGLKLTDNNAYIWGRIPGNDSYYLICSWKYIAVQPPAFLQLEDAEKNKLESVDPATVGTGAGQKPVYMRMSNYSCDDYKKIVPSMFLSAKSSGFTYEGDVKDNAGPGKKTGVFGTRNCLTDDKGAKAEIIAVPAQTSTIPTLPDTAYIWGNFPPATSYNMAATLKFDAGCLAASDKTTLGTAYVKKVRQVPVAQTGKLDQLNPAPVLFASKIPVNNAPWTTNAYGEKVPPRIHSWTSAMTWANNDPAVSYFMDGGANANKAWKPRQSPVYAEPLIAWYSNQPRQTQGNYKDSYIVRGYLTQNDTSNPNPANTDVYGPGFHLGTATPSIMSDVVYSAQTAADTYNYGGRGVHGKDQYSVGLDPLGIWRETLVVFPSRTNDPYNPAYYPANPLTLAQGDFDVVFSMDDVHPYLDADNPYAENYRDPTYERTDYLQMSIAQGSPFAQFAVHGSEAVTIGAVYLPGYLKPGDNGYIKGSVAGGVTDPQDLSVGNATVRYQIIYQQVNSLPNSNAEDNTTAKKSNWVSFAVIWDPSKIKAAKLTPNTKTAGVDKMTYYSLPFADLTNPYYFVVAALPNQMQNNVDPATIVFDQTTAQAWASQLAPYAFNYYQGQSAVSFYVGKKKDGTETTPNEVNVYYDPNLQTVGPVKEQGKTVFLLQPHQYSRNFKDGRLGDDKKPGRMPLNATADFLLNDPQYRNKKYWIVRGHLEAYADKNISLTYLMPSVLPYLPGSALAGKTKKGAVISESSLGKLSQQDINLNDFTYALVSGQSYPWMRNSGPAGSKFWLKQMGDAYATGQPLYQSAKLLNVLTGLTQNTVPDWYKNTGKDWLDKKSMVTDLFGQVAAVFNAGDSPTPSYFSCKSCPINSSAGSCSSYPGGKCSSYVYAYYDETTHHLILYPSGTVPSYGRPQSYGLQNQAIDAFGIATELGDSVFTYGYHIAAASLLAMAIQNPANSNYFTDDQKKWFDKDHMGPAIDLMIKDLAYAEIASGSKIPWWASQGDYPFPRLETMDLWTGIAYTDGFQLGGRAEFGKQHNSAQETQIAWAAIYLWGKATGRQEVADLGAFLYTLGSYAHDAYFYGALGTMVPDFCACKDGDCTGKDYLTCSQKCQGDAFAADFSAGGDFIPRATTNLAGGKPATWATYPDTNLFNFNETRGFSAWQLQPATDDQAGTGKYDDKTSSCTRPVRPFLSAAVYQGRQWQQGEDGVPALNTLVNLILPLEPLTMSVFRDRGYMKEASRAALLNGGQPFLSTSYSVVNNLFFTGLELPYSANVLYHDPTKDSAYPKDLSTYQPPPPFSNCEAFMTLNNKTLNKDNYKDKTGYAWFWELLTGGGGDKNYPWMNLPVPGTAAVKCKDVNGNDKSAAEILPTYIEKYFTVGGAVAGTFVDYYYLDRFGAPDFNYYCKAAAGDNIIQPMCMALSKQGDERPKGFVVHNPNGKEIQVQFYRVSDGSVLDLDGKGNKQITAGAHDDVYLDYAQ